MSERERERERFTHERPKGLLRGAGERERGITPERPRKACSRGQNNAS